MNRTLANFKPVQSQATHTFLNCIMMILLMTDQGLFICPRLLWRKRCRAKKRQKIASLSSNRARRM
ncbi:MAG TPA: hypothetical protein DCL75_21190 [Ktedonobacter sp.]|nr:hypothetical protein [Ktedonobacter sp.]HAH01298.1 hypothetical protein [Ktedonobacter sp.]HAT46695.1 hypothetical protein [Ktedonobacter sp.]HBE29112.1 hypothetical protein [Ktedonobacter sp.]HCF86632.1 hypothetical protein [Ktedonobacter sp.]